MPFVAADPLLTEAVREMLRLLREYDEHRAAMARIHHHDEGAAESEQD